MSPFKQLPSQIKQRSQKSRTAGRGGVFLDHMGSWKAWPHFPTAGVGRTGSVTNLSDHIGHWACVSENSSRFGTSAGEERQKTRGKTLGYGNIV